MADIVGSAFVRVKLLTDKLSKDIEKSVKKGLDDADLEKIGSDGGDELGGGVSDGFAGSVDKNVKKNAQDFMDKLRIELKKNADSTGRSVGDDLLDGLSDSIDKGLNTDAKNFLDRLRIELKKQGKDTGRETGDSILDALDDALSPSNIPIPDFPDLDPLPGFPGRRPDFDLDPDLFPDFLPELDKIKKEISEGSGFSRALEKLDDRLKKIGGGSKLGFFKQTILVVGAAITAALPYIQDVGSAVLAYATGLVAQIGFLGTALTGIGAAAGAAIGSFALAFIPIALAFKSETSFLDKFKDKADEVGQVFLRIGSATQLTLLPSLSIALDIIKGIVPLFSEFGIKIGKVVGNLAIFVAATLTSEDAQYRLRKIMASALRIFEMLIPIVLNVGDILSGIWLAASPAAELFVKKIGELVENWKVLTRVGLLSGTLESTLTKWYERAELLFGALGNLSGALFDILDIGADSSDNVFYQFDRWAERYRKWTESEEGKNKIALIFENALSVMRELNGIAADLFDGIFGRLGNIGGVDSMVESLENFRDIIPDIQKVWAEMYTQIKSISSGIFDKLKYAAEQLKDPLGRLGTQLLEFFRIMEETGAFEILIRLLVALTDTMAIFLAIPGLAQAAGYILAFSAAGKLATIGLKPFVKILGPVVSGMKNFTRAYAGASVTQLSMFPNLAGSTKGLGGFAGGLKSVVAAAKDAGKASLVASAAGGVGKIGSVAQASSAGVGALAKGVIGVGSSLLSVPGPTMIAGAALLAVGGAFAFSKYQSQKAAQEIRKNTEYFGTLRGGVEITTESIKRYNRETKTLSKGTLKLIEQVGLWDILTGSTDDSTKSLEKFAQKALDAGDLTVETISGFLSTAIPKDITDQFKDSLNVFDDIKEEFSLDAEEFERFLSGEEVEFDTGEFIRITGKPVEEIKEFLSDQAGSIKKTIGDWAKNEIVNDILSPEAIKGIVDSVTNANNTDIDTVQAFNSGNQQLRDGAILLAKDFEFLGKERIAQIRLQSINTAGLVDEAVATSLMKTEAEKLGAAWVEARKRFTSDEFIEAFPEAFKAAVEFSTVIDKIKNTTLDMPSLPFAKDLDTVQLGELVNKLGSVEEKMFVLDHFAPELKSKFGEMYRTMSDLPEEAFNAQATSLGFDAGKLRDVFNQVTIAIDELQQAALSKLPSIGQLLQDATTVKEDGSEVFNQKQFTKSLNQATLDTLDFTKNLEEIRKTGNKELLQYALESGPTVAAEIADGVGGVANRLLTEALAANKLSKDALTTWVAQTFGDELATLYGVQAGIIGGDFNTSLIGSMNSPAARLGIKNAASTLVDAFADEFMRTTITPVIDKDGTVRWGVKKGRPSTNQKPGLGLPELGSNTTTIFPSTGGFVPGGGGFRSGGRGTDTVPAWLTPGEFILRESVSSAIPKDILIALNNGDSHLLGLLQSPNANKSGIFSSGTSFRRVGEGGTSEGASTAAGRRAPAAQGNVIIQQMNIESPAPLESARMVADRLRIMQSQLSRR